MILEHWPEPPQLGPRSPDRCDKFPVALGVEAIYLNRPGSMKLMLCAAIRTAYWIDGRSYRPGPSKQQPCSARAIHHPLLRSWHQGGASDLSAGSTLEPLRTQKRPESLLRCFCEISLATRPSRGCFAAESLAS
jgi:hypothetical protein